MRKEQRQKFWPWAALAFLIGPMVFSACSLFGLNIGGIVPAKPGLQTATPTLVSTLVVNTATPTAQITVLPSTATQTATAAPSRTITPVPPPAQFPTPLPAESTQAPAQYAVQSGSPKYTRAFLHADQGCQWIGVAGQVFDANGAGAKGVAVLVSGSIDGQPIERAVLTADQSPLGPGGYEIFLSNQASPTAQAVSVQLFNLQSQPLSQPFQINIPNRCDQNLILVNFVRSDGENLVSGENDLKLFIPMVAH